MIGIYGDSFADSNPTYLIDRVQDRMPWPMVLADMLSDTIENHARAATSLWWSYKNFLTTYKKYDTIVFCYSNHNRWSNINFIAHDQTSKSKRELGLAHVFTEEQLPAVADEEKHIAETLIKARPFLYDEQLQIFIYQNVFDSINLLCKQNGIKLVNLMPFEQFETDKINISIDNASGACLTNLLEISGLELKIKTKTFEIPRHPRLAGFHKKVDKRFCHINPHNNRILATIIKESLDNGKNFNLALDGRFSYNIKHLEYII